MNLHTKRAATLTALTALCIAATTPAYADPKEKVGVCHRTASETNPYVYIEVPEDQANGHITGTSSQHNHSVTWPEAGTWRGVPHEAGDERLDYLATSAADCEDTEPELPEIPLPTAEVLDPCGVGNATWVLPADTETLDWTLSEAGLLFVNPIGATFPGGSTVYDLGYAAETNVEDCPTEEPPGECVGRPIVGGPCLPDTPTVPPVTHVPNEPDQPNQPSTPQRVPNVPTVVSAGL